MTPAFIQLNVLKEQNLAAASSEFAQQCFTDIRGQSVTAGCHRQPPATLDAGCIYAVTLHPKPAQSLLCKSYIVPSTRPVKPFLLPKFSSFPFPTSQLMSNPSFLQSF